MEIERRPKRKHHNHAGPRGKQRGSHSGRGQHRDRRTGNRTRTVHYLQPRLLLLIAQTKNAYGYQLIEGLGKLEFEEGTPEVGGVYRTLRGMEEEGLVTSEWDTGGGGAAKRVYRLTHEGEDRLQSWVASLRQRKLALEHFLEVYDAYLETSVSQSKSVPEKGEKP